MVDVDGSFFWVLQEDEINNEDLFLPSDTPAGKIYSKKLYKVLKKRHANQRSKLLKKQINDLAEYQKKFCADNKDDLFVETKKPVICQMVNGLDFLVECRQALDNVIQKTIQVKSNYSNQGNSFDINVLDEQSLKEKDQIEERERKYQEMIKEKYKEGFTKLNETHIKQMKALEEYQNQDFIHIPPEFLTTEPLPSHDPPTIKPSNIKPPTTNPSITNPPVTNPSITNPPTTNPPITRPPTTNPPITRPPTMNPHDTNLTPSRPSNPFSLTDLPSQTPSFSSLALKPTPTPISIPSNFPSKVPLFSTHHMRDPRSPMFNHQKITSLIDDGTIHIMTKPNRVMIKGTNYGDPRDYDDAINGVPNRENPITKRFMAGEYYLFHKSKDGVLVTIGPVSKIQPLIHKFFLST